MDEKWLSRKGCGGEAAVHLGGSAAPSPKEPSASKTPMFPQSNGLYVSSMVGGDWIPGCSGAEGRVRAPASAWSAAGTSLLEFVLSLLAKATSTTLCRLHEEPHRSHPSPRAASETDSQRPTYIAKF